MNDFTILHLSDLHINQEGERLSLIMDNLLIDIEQEMKLVDDIIIVVTGDIVHRGNYKYRENAIVFFKKLKKILRNKIKDIYIVPGNHDKIRNPVDAKILQEYDSSDKFADAFYKNYWKYFLVSFSEYQSLVEEIYSIFFNKQKIKSNN